MNQSNSAGSNEEALGGDDPYCNRDVPVLTSCLEGEGEGELNNPSGIAIHPKSSNLYITDAKNYRVQIYDPDGIFITTFCENLSDPCGIRIVEDRVYVTQNPGHHVTVFQEDGNLINRFGRSGSKQPEEFRHPYDVDVDRTNGDIYVCDLDNNRIQIFTRDFRFKTMFKSRDIKRPHNLKIIDRELYILNQSENGELVHILEESMYINRIKTDTMYPICFDIDKDGNYLILEYYHRKSIKIFSKDGVFLRRIAEGVFPSMPRSLTIDRQGRIVVVCGTNYKSKDCLYFF